MVPAELLGMLERVVSSAVRVTGTYMHRPDNAARSFGGVNVIMFVDFWQLHPITGVFLASNPFNVPPGCGQHAMQMFWETNKDNIRSFWQLTELMRCEDPWYNAFLLQCRVGDLSMEDYCYFHGFPTLRSPCVGKCKCNDEIVQDTIIGSYRRAWRKAFLEEHADMATFLKEPQGECAECKAERAARHRVLTKLDCLPRDLHKPPFSGAPALYTFNVPRYFATHLRAREYAKQQNIQLAWCHATDVPLHPDDCSLPPDRLEAKLLTWLRRHDQDTAHLPSIYPLAVGMPVRLTDNIDRVRQLFRGRKGSIYGWTLAHGCIPEEVDDELILDALPLAVYISFPGATWKIGDLPVGVYPMKKRTRNWKVNKHTGIEARRTGYCFIADFGSTAHMIQGATLEAAFVDLQQTSTKATMTSQIAAYVCLSRVKKLRNICVMQPFSTSLFTQGNPRGPERLVRKLSGQISAEDASTEWRAVSEGVDADVEATTTTEKLLCTSCYLGGKEIYMLHARDFGIGLITNHYGEYLAQGRWTRCLQCMRSADLDISSQVRREDGAKEIPRANLQHEDTLAPSSCPPCLACLAHQAAWKKDVTPGSHGCAACKEVFPESTWQLHKIKDHRRRHVDLVCPACEERGFAAGKYKEYGCTECGRKFGMKEFGHKAIREHQHKGNARLVCSECEKMLRCRVCKNAYEWRYWTKHERGGKHQKLRKTALVCRQCRAEGFIPEDVTAYTCRTCKKQWGTKKFDRVTKIQCIHCDIDRETRVRELQQRMKGSRRKCTCWSPIHAARCPLTATAFMEQRWPGSDGAISEEDRNFLDALQPLPTWWKKAWGR